MANNEYLSATLRRWAHISLITIVLTLCGCFLVAGTSLAMSSAADRFGRLLPWLKISGILFASILLAIVLLKLMPLSSKHHDFFLRYPPTWIAPALAIIAVCVLDLTGAISTDGPHFQRTTWLWIFLFTMLAATLAKGLQML